ncbi:MAG: hypothetical protein ACK2T5_16810, partial [Anaerolineales bacterium]
MVGLRTIKLVFLLWVFILLGIVDGFGKVAKAHPEAMTVSGEISVDTIWSGEVLIMDTVVVLPDVTLTISPGTRVEFLHYRGYREPEKRLSLIVKGRIIANGNAAEPIYFSSDADDPQNGDWSMLRLIPVIGQPVSS